MKVLTETRLLEVEPGDNAALTVEVLNNGDIIDGVSASVLGIADELVSATPAMLPLFPDSAGKVTLGVAVPLTHPAGRHPLTVQIVSHGTGDAPTYIDVDLDVASRPGLRLSARPRLVRARRTARSVLELHNTGNVALDVMLNGHDPDRQVEIAFVPERRRVEPGAIVPVMLVMRGPRMFTGAEIDRSVVVEATARPANAWFPGPGPVGVPGYGPLDPGGPDALEPGVPVPAGSATDRTTEFPAVAPAAGGFDPVDDLDPAADEDELASSRHYFTLVREQSVRMRQRPLISRGLLTILILIMIVAVWAGIFLLGLAKVFAGDPMTKQAPASFFSANTPAAGGGAAGSGSGSGSGGSGAGGSGAAAGAAPAGALSKSGQLAPGMGGTVSGTVRSANDQQPVGRILVQAYRVGPKGLIEMSSAASQSDGTYTLAGLFPTSYYLQFSASGYKPLWYPNRPTRQGATLVTAVAQGVTSGVNASVVGLPATISGTIDPGDTLKPVVTTVIARPLLGSNTGKVAARARTNGSGAYSLAKLPAPGSYQLTFTTPGYTASSLVDTVGGGDKRLEPKISLSSASGQISGVVTQGGKGLGGATVTTTLNGKALTVLTPTTGQVGAFVLTGLSTPSTYVVTVSSPGRGSTSRIVDLAAGQASKALNVNLSSGSNTITGIVVGPKGKGLGGATVTVGGAAGAGSSPSATTLTAGSPGRFSITGLKAPGSYTLTVQADGYAPTSIAVPLSGSGVPDVKIRLATKLGSLRGTITSASGAALGGATVTASNGQRTYTTTSSSSDGGYDISGLPQGSYSVTVVPAGSGSQRTALVTISAGSVTRQNIRVGS